MTNEIDNQNTTRGSDNLFRSPQTTLLTDEQWLIVQKRYHMTPRELEIARLICRGMSNEEIAEAVNIKYGTVKTHIRNIYRRIHVKSKVAMLLRFLDDVKAAADDSQAEAASRVLKLRRQ
jgi:DNA-binding CsgD family transcriptional regulator